MKTAYCTYLTVKVRSAAVGRKPNSVPLRADDHSSRPGIADGLKRPTRKLRTGRPLVRLRSLARASARHRFPIWSCSVRGFACHLPYSRRGALLPHLFTLTCVIPVDHTRFHRVLRTRCTWWEWRGSRLEPRHSAWSTGMTRRYIFCATSPSSHPDRALPGALPFGVRTFLLPSPFQATAGDHLADCDVLYCTSPSDRGLGIGDSSELDASRTGRDPESRQRPIRSA